MYYVYMLHMFDLNLKTLESLFVNHEKIMKIDVHKIVIF